MSRYGIKFKVCAVSEHVAVGSWSFTTALTAGMLGARTLCCTSTRPPGARERSCASRSGLALICSCFRSQGLSDELVSPLSPCAAGCQPGRGLARCLWQWRRRTRTRSAQGSVNRRSRQARRVTRPTSAHPFCRCGPRRASAWLAHALCTAAQPHCASRSGCAAGCRALGSRPQPRRQTVTAFAACAYSSIWSKFM
jgi:hypothetical protein